jgi:hypothetical protein
MEAPPAQALGQFDVDGTPTAPCPNYQCGVLTQKVDGCNYLKCPLCACEWCWLCCKQKYVAGGCSEQAHNSH